MKKILVISDDLWHPAEIVEKGFSYLSFDGYEVEMIRDAKDTLTPELLAEYEFVFCCKGNTINQANTAPWFEEGVTDVGPAEIRAYIENGGTYVLVHAGSSLNPANVPEEERFRRPARAYSELVGTIFNGHPLRCPVSIHVVDPDHPLMEGVSDFTERDEHYMLEVTAENVTPLFVSSSEPGGQDRPSGFLFPIGKGRVIVVAPGHTLWVWKNPNFQRILLNIVEKKGQY